MGEVFLALLLLAGGLALLAFGADILIKGSVSLAKRFSVPELVIGLTIVSFGTSSPELIVNSLASYQNKPEIVFGNILGSNIVNLLLILGVSACIYPLSVQVTTVWKEIPFSVVGVILLALLLHDRLLFGLIEDQLAQIDGLLLLIIFVGFLLYVLRLTKEESLQGEIEEEIKVYSLPVTLLMIVGGLAGLFGGGHLVVSQAVAIARLLGVSEKLIALTIVAGGTSLPELAASTVAAFRRRCDIAVGNVIGSGIFNIFFILGVSALIRPMRYDLVMDTDLLVLFFSNLLLFAFMFIGERHRLDRWEAALFLGGYFAYLLFLIQRG